MTDGPATLGDALPLEIERVQNLLPIYDQIPLGFIAATMMRASLKRAVASLANGDDFNWLFHWCAPRDL